MEHVRRQSIKAPTNKKSSPYIFDHPRFRWIRDERQEALCDSFADFQAVLGFRPFKATRLPRDTLLQGIHVFLWDVALLLVVVAYDKVVFAIDGPSCGRFRRLLARRFLCLFARRNDIFSACIVVVYEVGKLGFASVALVDQKRFRSLFLVKLCVKGNKVGIPTGNLHKAAPFGRSILFASVHESGACVGLRLCFAGSPLATVNDKRRKNLGHDAVQVVEKHVSHPID